MESESKVFLFEEVAEHNHKDDCWLIISGKVYDVTSFLDDHPGGDDILLTSTGKDATEEFEDAGLGHSDEAREMMKKYYVGKVDVSSLPVNEKQTLHPPSSSSSTHDQGSGLVIKLLQFLVPLLVLGVAFYLKNFNRE